MCKLSGFNEEALNDKSWQIRRHAYRALGYKNYKKSTQDDHWLIRLEGYQCLGFNNEALQDKDIDIRKEAELYFKIKNRLENQCKSEYMTKEERAILNQYVGE